MNNELQAILNYMERERGINRETLLQAVEFALQSAARKGLHNKRDSRVEIDRKTYDIKVFAKVLVVDQPKQEDEVNLARARQVKADVKLARLLIFGALNWSVQWYDRRKPASLDELTEAAIALFIRE